MKALRKAFNAQSWVFQYVAVFTKEGYTVLRRTVHSNSFSHWILCRFSHGSVCSVLQAIASLPSKGGEKTKCSVLESILPSIKLNSSWPLLISVFWSIFLSTYWWAEILRHLLVDLWKVCSPVRIVTRFIMRNLNSLRFWLYHLPLRSYNRSIKKPLDLMCAKIR